jgi:hypothetical protein
MQCDSGAGIRITRTTGTTARAESPSASAGSSSRIFSPTWVRVRQGLLSTASTTLWDISRGTVGGRTQKRSELISGHHGQCAKPPRRRRDRGAELRREGDAVTHSSYLESVRKRAHLAPFFLAHPQRAPILSGSNELSCSGLKSPSRLPPSCGIVAGACTTIHDRTPAHAMAALTRRAARSAARFASPSPRSSSAGPGRICRVSHRPRSRRSRTSGSVSRFAAMPSRSEGSNASRGGEKSGRRD